MELGDLQGRQFQNIIENYVAILAIMELGDLLFLEDDDVEFEEVVAILAIMELGDLPIKFKN